MINRKLTILIVNTLCLLIVAMGLSVLRGWVIKDAYIVQIRPDFAPMQFNTAMCFVLAAVALLLTSLKHYRLGLFFSTLVLVFTSLSLLQYFLGADFGIDTLFNDPFTTVRTSHPGRMAPNTALNFILLSLGVLVLTGPFNVRSKGTSSMLLGVLVISIALTALIGYGTGLDGSLIWGEFTRMALNTSASFAILGAALVLVGVYNSEFSNFYEIPFLPQILSGATLLLTVLIWIALQSTTTLHIRTLLEKHSFDLSRDMNIYFQLEAEAIRRMARRMHSTSGSEPQFSVPDARIYLEDFTDIIAIAWVSNTGDTPKAQVNKNFSNLDEVKPYLLAQANNPAEIREILFDLVRQDTQGTYLRMRVRTSSEEGNTGTLIAITDLATMFDRIISDREQKGYRVTLLLNNTPVLKQSGEADPRWNENIDLTLGGIDFIVSSSATSELIQDWQIYVPMVFLVAGVLMSMLVGIVLRLFQTTREMTHEITQANKSLHDALREAETARTQLEAKSQALAQSNQDLENFASIASHDLSEPLRKITMFGERLMKHSETSLDDKSRQYLEVMIDGAGRMRALLNSLLDYSRVATKGGEFTSTNLSDVLVDVQSDLAELISENNAEIIYEDLPVINADYTQMRQLFQNLIANSMRYHKPDVSPRIEIALDTETAPKNRIRIAVKDNGIGFEQENADKIFEVFTRLHTRSEYPGTGMGLAVCKRIMERHKGGISARGEPDKGATFMLDFPKY